MPETAEAPLPAPRNPNRTPDIPRNPELQPTGENRLAAAVARIVRGGEALNPRNTTLQKLERPELDKAVGYDALNNGSYQERKDWWDRQEEKTFDARMSKWTRSTVTAFDAGQDFFNKTPDGMRWKGFLEKMGINTEGFGESNARQLYDTFFDKDTKLSKTDVFVTKVLEACGKDNYVEIKKNQDVIQWVGKIFGKNGSEITEMFAELEAKKKAHPDKIVEEANKEENGVLRINTLGEETLQAEGYSLSEKAVVEYLYRGQTTPTPKPGEVYTGPTGETQNPDQGDDSAPAAPAPEGDTTATDDDSAPAAPTTTEEPSAPTAPTTTETPAPGTQTTPTEHPPTPVHEDPNKKNKGKFNFVTAPIKGIFSKIRRGKKPPKKDDDATTPPTT